MRGKTTMTKENPSGMRLAAGAEGVLAVWTMSNDILYFDGGLQAC
jgi:hypothetical protein